MKIKSYKLFLEKINIKYLPPHDDDFINVIRKIVLDRIDGEIIDGVELTEQPDDVSLFNNDAYKRALLMEVNGFGIYKSSHWFYGSILDIIISFKSNKILPYIKIIEEDIKDLELRCHLKIIEPLKKGNPFIYTIEIYGPDR